MGCKNLTDKPPGVLLQIVDFDGESLRRTLPAIVKTLEGALSAGGRVGDHPSWYLHVACTGSYFKALCMGPAACISDSV